MNEEKKQNLINKSKEIRNKIIETAFKAQKGHILSAFSIVDILVCLYYEILNIDPMMKEDRDRFILSKGHGCLALYCILADLNFFSIKELDKFCTFEGILGGHPSRGKILGIEASTGSLGHGPSLGIGMALSLKKENNRTNVFVLIGDGECNEGSIWEAALSANKHRLSNYWIIVDNNKFQSYGPVDEICPLEALDKKWESFGFSTRRIDLKDDPYHFVKTVAEMKNITGPKCIICDGIKGLGSKFLEGNLEFHHIRSMSEQMKDFLLKDLKDENFRIK